MPACVMIGTLVGMQAQVPTDPYTGLWARLEAFDPAELSTLLVDRAVVRMGTLRTTLHLMTAADALALRAFTKPVLLRAWSGSPFAPHLAGVDMDEVEAAGRTFLETAPATTAALGRHLGARWPGVDPTSLAYALQFRQPIVQVPPRGTWGATQQATWTTIEAWLGQPVPETTDEARILLRYLAAFGPASVQDLRIWSWRTKLAAIIEPLRSQLVTFHGPNGVELFDLPDAPRPDPETPAPVRFLPEFDNLLLSHKDRSRFMRHPLSYDRAWRGTLLVDGLVRGTWRPTRSADGQGLQVGLFEPPTPAEGDAIEAEARSLLGFLTDGRGGAVRIEPRRG